ncbi:MAG: ABC transporter ATP-binding protein [Candidatus Hydrothermarchaeales archaeon]
MIQIKGLTTHLGGFSLIDVDLDINEREYFGMLGPTGSGKTILLECIAGLHYPEKGEIRINGRDVTRMTPEEREVAYVPQDQALFPHLNVRGNIAFGLKLKGYSKSDVDSKIKEITELLDITHLIDRDIQKLSGGERQRVALARALVIGPKLLLLDEPLVALDPKIKQRIWKEMKKIHERLNVTIVHVSHDFEEVYTLSDRIGVINDGRIEQVAEREEIFNKPKNRVVARFVGTKNIFDGEVVDSSSEDNYLKIMWRDHSLETRYHPFSVGDEVTFCIRPEQVMIVSPSHLPREKTYENMLKGRIVEEIPSGIMYALFFQMEGSGEEYDFEIHLPSHSYDKLGLAQNKDIVISLKRNAVHVF